MGLSSAALIEENAQLQSLVARQTAELAQGAAKLARRTTELTRRKAEVDAKDQ